MVGTAAKARIVILYGVGGLSDVGRHCVQVAVNEQADKFEKVTVLTQHPELLGEPNWNCGCPGGHSFSDDDKQRFQLVHVKDWKDHATLIPHFQDATCVVSCVGNRQPTWLGVKPESWCSFPANQMVIQAMKQHQIRRVVVMSSMGVEEDWPPMEWLWPGKVMACIFTCFARKAYKDLTETERAYRAAGDFLDYLLIRPVGIGEDVLPENRWRLQTEKYKDASLGMDMAKLDVARYMIRESLEPTRKRDAVVIGSIPPEKSNSKKD